MASAGMVYSYVPAVDGREIMKEKKLLTKDNLYISIIAAVLSFTLTMFAPLEIYLTNIKEFWFGVKLLMPVLLLVFAGVLITSLIVLNLVAVFSKKVAYVLTYIYFVLVALLYIQGNFVVSTLGSLDGTSIDWNVVNPDRIISAVLWIVGIVLVIVIYCRIGSKEKLIKTVSYISIALVLLETVTLVSVTIMNKSQFASKYYYCATSKDEFSLSKNENVLIFVLDSFDSGLFNEVISADESYKSPFDGFTYYPDTLGCFNSTDLALPEIMTGVAYKNQENYADYMIQNLSSNPLYERMLHEDWNMGIYSTSYLIPCDFVKQLTNVVCLDRVRISSKRKLIEDMYRLVGYKYLPYELKKYVWFDPAEINNLKDIDDEMSDSLAYAKKSFDWSNEVFMNQIESMDTSMNQNVFRLYHIKGTHVPFLTDEFGRSTDVEPIDTQDVASYEDSVVKDTTVAKGNIYILNKYFEALKEKGIYDKTTIIVMADHGLDRTEKSMKRQNPLLLIKGKSESHELSISDKALSYTNLREIYIKLMQGVCGEDIVRDIDNDARYFGWYQGSIHVGSNFCSPITEYVLYGSATDCANLEETGIVYEWKQK